ncbi:hypothetical protein ACSBR2_042591 [Camellia fascicularis]
MEKPWLVAGDFNDYGSQNERRSFSLNHTSRRTQKFLDRVNNCNLLDLGSTGPRLTWTNNRQGLANIMERLDRAMCNEDWRTMFPEATIQVIPRTYSDHSPLIVHTQDMNNNLLESTAEFTLKVSVWNKEVFGNIFKWKRLLLARIEGIQRAQTTNFSHSLQALEKDLINQYNVTLF